jgi:hypothetical protein
MKMLLLSIFCIFTFSGCYSKCGFTEKYYCSCEEYYDANGIYHMKCPDDFLSINIGAQMKKPDRQQQSMDGR